MNRRIPRGMMALGLPLAMSMLSPNVLVGQNPSPRTTVMDLGLEHSEVGRVTVYYASPDRARAEELGELIENAALRFEREFDLSFPVEIAALGPDDWFSEFPGVPYAVPWASISERLLLLPSSLTEGVLVGGTDAEAGRRRVDFVALHEYGHVAAKEYFRPESKESYAAVSWFEELVATYFAFAYIATADPDWAEAAKREWVGQVEGFTPTVQSLDWGFMESLPGPELAQTYAWYQFLLNLRSAEIYEQHGVGFLPALRAKLRWSEANDWTSSELLDDLEDLAPQFVEWARAFGGDRASKSKRRDYDLPLFPLNHTEICGDSSTQ